METNINSTITVSRKYLLESGIQRWGKEFYWIAGLSILNSLVLIFGGQWVMVVGLGITQGFDYLIATSGGAERIIAIIINLLIVGFFVFLGYKATQLKRWAFITGAVLYGLDTLIFIFAKDIVGVIFHLLILIGIVQGIRLFSEWKKIKDMPEEVSATSPTVETKKTKFESLPNRQRGPFIVGLVTFGLLIPPLLWIAIYYIFKIDIYDNAYDSEGNLKKWGANNKLAVLSLLAIQTFVWVGILRA